ncbi:MAG: hypothetical protein H0U74_14115 [Bradymonadaceae bacterium]|nr:hypothetical protein [Lujinxingiaceae bacterium]
MDRWQQHLRSLDPRADLRESFYPELVDDYRPALLNAGSLLTACLVGARLLDVVAMRGGTRIKPTIVKKLRAVIEAALSPEVVHHCDEESARILLWLDGRAETLQRDDDAPAITSDTPELDMMFAADLESRISVARFALRESFDLELEYYDPISDSWPRLRATPIDIRTPDGADPDDEDELELVIAVDHEKSLAIAIKTLRWLMPVNRRFEHNHEPTSRKGRLLSFPKRSDD